MIQPTAGGPIYYTDGNQVKVDGVNTPSAATGTTLTGLTYAAVTTPLLYAVDNAAAGTAMGVPSGLYAFNPATALTVTPVTTQDGNGNPVQFKAPVGAVYAADTSGNSKLFVIDANGIEIVDINQATQSATNVGPLLCTGTPLAAAPTGVKLFGTVAVGSSSSTFLVSDPGNSRVAQVAVTSNFNCTITTYATGAPFTGLYSVGAGALYATSTTGQIYYISGSGATAVSLGLNASTTLTDGPIGQITSLKATNTLTPVNYPLQGQAKSFFATTATPSTSGYGTLYTVAPFAAAGPVFTVAATGIGLANDTSSAATTGAGTVNATGGLVVVPSTTAASATLTPGSLLFVDVANKKLRTIVQ